VADTGVVDLDADLMGLWRGNLDVLDGEGLASTPGDCGLWQLSIRARLGHGLVFAEPLAWAASGDPYFAGDGLDSVEVNLVSVVMQTRVFWSAHGILGRRHSPCQQCLPWCTTCS